jgi:CRISPR-associated protein Csd2
MTYTDPGKRHDFVLLFDVTNGNPNGDPDADNQPRIDLETGHGLVTDVAIKRKVRDYVALYKGRPIFIQSQVALNTLILRAFRDIGVQPPQIPLDDEELRNWLVHNAPENFAIEDGTLVYGGESPREPDIRSALLAGLDDAEDDKNLRRKLQTLARRIAEAAKKQQIGRTEQMRARDRLCQDYYDIRMFGAVLSTGLNAGQVRGPAQLTFARSLHPVRPLGLSITRQARTTTERMGTGPTEMGRKSIVPYGLYRAHGYFNPYFAEQTGVMGDDLALFWEALAKMFEFDHSAARGEMTTCGLYVFTHDSPLGNASSRRLFQLVDAHLSNGVAGNGVAVPRTFNDYVIDVNDRDLPSGVTIERLVG